MRKALFWISIATPMLLLAFGIGAWTAIQSYWGTPIATVNVSNESDREIESVTVTYTTCGLKRELIHRLADQHAINTNPRAVSMSFVLCGEGSHTTKVVLQGGSTWTSKGSYIEGGYEVTEHVTTSGIRSDSIRTLP
jgi:hypothetical protein